MLLFSAICHAQVQQLEEVVLRAQRIQSSIQPLSQTTVAQDSLLLKQDIGELLQGVPSLFVSSQQNFSQDTRISIRGFGTRATFGIRGIKVLWDGIPRHNWTTFRYRPWELLKLFGAFLVGCMAMHRVVLSCSKARR